MSTDIIRFPTDAGKQTRAFSKEALLCYLGITMPFMVGTFLASWAFHTYDKQRTSRKRQEGKTECAV